MNNWNYEKLSKLCFRIGDGLHGTPSYVEGSGIYFINGNNLKNGRIEITNNTKCVSEEELKNNFIELNKNSLLLSINGTLGSMAFYRNEKVMLGKSSAYLNFTSPINKFYYYYFQLPFVQEYFFNVATGSTIKNLSLKSIQDFEVPVPEFNVWNNIANVLSSLDSKIELNNRINAELESMAQTIYDYWFVQYELPDKNGKPYKTSGGKMFWNEELKREIPEGWEVKTFGDVVAIKNGRDHKHLNNGDYPVYGSGGVMRQCDTFLYDSESILIPRKGSLGNLFYINEPFWCVDTIFYTQMKFPQSCKYLFYTTQNFNISKMNTGTAVPSMTTEILNNLTLVFPPSNILKSFDDILIPVFEKKSKTKLENQKLTELRDWLLPMLMNGQVKVN